MKLTATQEAEHVEENDGHGLGQGRGSSRQTTRDKEGCRSNAIRACLKARRNGEEEPSVLKKKMDALGKVLARMLGASPGLEMAVGKAEVKAPETVTMRKP